MTSTTTSTTSTISVTSTTSSPVSKEGRVVTEDCARAELLLYMERQRSEYRSAVGRERLDLKGM